MCKSDQRRGSGKELRAWSVRSERFRVGFRRPKQLVVVIGFCSVRTHLSKSKRLLRDLLGIPLSVASNLVPGPQE